jgi:magnesium transporter
MRNKKYLDYIINPLGLLSTKKVLKVNPTILPTEIESENIKVSTINFLGNDIQMNEHVVTNDFLNISELGVSWINIDGFNKKKIEEIANRLGIHPLIVEDILSVGLRPKTDEIDGVLFSVLNMLYFNEKHGYIESEQIGLILGRGFVMSIQQDAEKDVFNLLREKLKINNSKPRQNGADFLYYSMLDAIVDHYFVVMEKLAESIEQLEDDVVKNPNNRTLVKINNIRKQMILLKRSVGPVRDLINGILKSESALIEPRTEKYFKDVLDHIIQANDLAENYRDMLVNIHDLYMNNVNLRLNESMKIMAIVTCMLAPATVVGGIFGMNFDQIPLIHNKWGFGVTVGLMLLVPILMFIYFKRRRWF